MVAWMALWIGTPAYALTPCVSTVTDEAGFLTALSNNDAVICIDNDIELDDVRLDLDLSFPTLEIRGLPVPAPTIKGLGIGPVFDVWNGSLTLTNLEFDGEAERQLMLVDRAAVVAATDVTFRNGLTTGPGGCVEVVGSSTLSLVDGAVEDCEATGRGAGVAVLLGELEVTGTEFRTNKVVGATYGGGAVSVDNNCVATFTDVLFDSNAAVDAGQGGGAAMLRPGAVATFTDCTFEGNTSGPDPLGDDTRGVGGGAVYSFEGVTITGGRFDDNSYTGTGQGGGGAVYARGPDVIVDGVVFDGNTSAGAYGGGALYVRDPADLAVSDSFFLRNVATGADGGGAVHLRVHSAPDGLITDTMFCDNSTDGQGGALFLHTSDTTVSYSTFMLNEAGDYGGGIYVMDSGTNGVSMDHLTLASNTATVSGAAVYSNRNSAKLVESAVLWHDTVFAADAGDSDDLASEYSFYLANDLDLGSYVNVTYSEFFITVDEHEPTSCDDSVAPFEGSVWENVGAHEPVAPDIDGDGYDVDEDCNDLDDTIHPGAYDLCGDGIDSDCDDLDGCDTGHTGASGATGETGDTGLVVHTGEGETADTGGLEDTGSPGDTGTVDETGTTDSGDGAPEPNLSSTASQGCGCDASAGPGLAWWSRRR